MLIVRRIADRVQLVVEARHTSTVFRWTMMFAIHAGRIGTPRIGRQYFLDCDPVLPAVAEVVGVNRLCADLDEHAAQARGMFAGVGQTHEPFIRVRRPEQRPPDTEVMHVAVFPPHRYLQHVMQLRQGQIRRYQQPAPDRRIGAEQGDLDLIDFRWKRALFHWHVSLLRC